MCLEHVCIPVGIYRHHNKVVPGSSFGEDNSFKTFFSLNDVGIETLVPYVFSCPLPDTRLHVKDKIYVLARSKIAEVTWDE